MRHKVIALILCSWACSAQVQTGKLPSSWNTPAAADCVTAPNWLIHEYNEDFYILRESGCTNYEKPFLYLLFGKERVLLEDTGAGQPDTARVVSELIAKWAKQRNRAPVPLTVVHSHGHKDHTAGDAGFNGRADIELIPASVTALSKAFGIEKWPDQIGQVDLGGRVIDVLPIPGHEEASIALYDRITGVLLTGDSVYPGRLYVSDLGQFTRSIARLIEFTGSRPVAHVLGTHIEQSRTPFVDYVVGTTFQPYEHSLELGRAHLLELGAALTALSGKPAKVALRDFTIVPRGAMAAPFVPSSFQVPTRYETSKYKLVSTLR